jgi:hypothetical protein
MKLRSLLLLTLSLLFSAGLIAQNTENPKIKFEKTTHDFGELDKGDKAEYTFQFTNVSEEPLKLTRVKASCGCTTPAWTNTPVEPGGTGEIKVSYNTQRIGGFSKTVTVTYEQGERPLVLYIKGKVNNKVDPLAAQFPNKKGNLAFDKINDPIGILESKSEKESIFRFANIGTQPISIQDIQTEMMFEAEVDQKTLIPGQKATLTVKSKGDRFIQAGAFNKVVTLVTNDPAQPNKTINVSGTLEKVYSEEELAQMPNIEFYNTTYDAGKVLEGEKVEIAFRFKNSGKDDLVIESVKASCGCTATAPKDKVIKAGQESEIVATFNSRGRQGVQNKSVTVRSNDPDNPNIVLRLKVEVEKDPFHMDNAGPATGRINR